VDVKRRDKALDRGEPPPLAWCARQDGRVPLYDDTRSLADYVGWTEQVLAPHGFRPQVALALVSVCRDELMHPFAEAVTATWGAAFDMSSLGGYPLLGRTGLAAALGHAPDAEGRHRLVVHAFTHIGVDDDGTVGQVHRDGVEDPTSACGALVVARAALEQGVSGVVLDRHDVEESHLVAQLRRVLGESPAPGLLPVTELVRDLAVGELGYLLDEAARTHPELEVALLSGVVVHDRHRDVVAVTGASVRSSGGEVDLMASLA
jgi:hypothetical protein